MCVVGRGGALGREPALLRGDLDWIVMKAMEKDRTRRYETANAFAERGFEKIGAWIPGRHMFRPARGPWPDASRGACADGRPRRSRQTADAAAAAST